MCRIQVLKRGRWDFFSALGSFFHLFFVIRPVVDIVSNDSLTGVERLVDLSHRIR